MVTALMEPGAEPIPGYRLVEPLGEGGYGAVWRAVAPGGVHVAMKFLRVDQAKIETELRALQSISAIRHPHLLDIHFAKRAGAQIVIATSLCDRSLFDRFEECQRNGRRGIPLSELLQYMQETARAIDFLNQPTHRAADGSEFGVQHRDIKPQNIFLVGGSVKVADFGLAKVLESSVASHSGAMTPYYAAPEMFDAKVSSSSDQYSLAVTYCKLRGGGLPFSGSPTEVLMGVLTKPPNLDPIPENERPAVERALAKTPGQRWPSCQEFVGALHSAAQHSLSDELPLTGEASRHFDVSDKGNIVETGKMPTTDFPLGPPGGPLASRTAIPSNDDSDTRMMDRKSFLLSCSGLALGIVLSVTWVLMTSRDGGVKPSASATSGAPPEGATRRSPPIAGRSNADGAPRPAQDAKLPKGVVSYEEAVKIFEREGFLPPPPPPDGMHLPPIRAMLEKAHRRAERERGEPESSLDRLSEQELREIADSLGLKPDDAPPPKKID